MRLKWKLVCLRKVRSLLNIDSRNSIFLSIYEELLVVKVNDLWIGNVLLKRENCTHSSEDILIIDHVCIAELCWMLSQVLLILSLSECHFRLLKRIERLWINKLKLERLMLADLMLVLVEMLLLKMICMMKYLGMTVLVKLFSLLLGIQLELLHNLNSIKFLEFTCSWALWRGIWKTFCHRILLLKGVINVLVMIL